MEKINLDVTIIDKDDLRFETERRPEGNLTMLDIIRMMPQDIMMNNGTIIYRKRNGVLILIKDRWGLWEAKRTN